MINMKNNRFILFSFLGFLASTLFINNFSSAYAQTEANPTVLDTAEALAVDAKFYAEAYGVSQEEAVKRLSIMFDIGAEADVAESEEGDDFAGSYFDNSAPQFALVVRTKKRINPIAYSKGRRESKLVVIPLPRPSVELSAGQCEQSSN
jgi:hypothetical protein